MSATAHIWAVLNHCTPRLWLILVVTVAVLFCDDALGSVGQLLWLTLCRLVAMHCVARLSVVSLWLVTATHADLSSYLAWSLRLDGGTQGHVVRLVYAIIAVLTAISFTHGCSSRG